MNNGEGKFIWQLRLHTKYHLDSWIAEGNDGLNIFISEDGTSILEGPLPDMAAVYGVILRIRDLAVEVISLHLERRHGG